MKLMKRTTRDVSTLVRHLKCYMVKIRIHYDMDPIRVQVFTSSTQVPYDLHVGRVVNREHVCVAFIVTCVTNGFTLLGYFYVT